MIRTAVKTIGLLAILMQLLFWWVIASAVTSGIKVVKEQCGTRYGIESVVAGNWFCPVP